MNRRFKLSLCSAAVATLLSAPAIAANVTTGKVSINSDSQTVAISGYTQPVVIAGVPTMNDGEPGVVSVSGVSANGFDIRFKEWPYLDGVHGLEDVAYMVLEKGRHQMSDGSIWEVGTISQNSGNAQVFFGAPFDGTPVVLLTSQTQSEGDTHALRAHSVTRHSFSSRLFEQELGDSHGVEVTGYVAIYQPKGVGKTDSGIGYTLSTEVAANNVLHTPLGKLTVQEEQSKDSETRHTHEVLAIARIGGSTFATDNSLYGGDAITLRYTPTYEVVPGDKTGDNDNIALMGTNNLTAANYSASSTYSYDSPQGAFDGHIFPNIKVNNDATALEKRGTWLAYGVPQWLQVDFGRKTMVTGFSITSSTSYPSRTPKEVTLEVSNDGMTYHSHETRLLAKGGEQVALSEPAVGQYFRLKVSSTHGDSYIQVGELEYYGDFVDLVGDAPNPPSMTPEISCKAWLDKDSSLADGIYLLDPDEAGGVDPFYAYCDMTTDGGGWTRVGHFYNVNDLGDFSETPAQVSDPDSKGWHVAFGQVKGNEIRLAGIKRNLPVSNETLAGNIINAPRQLIIGNGQLKADTIYINTEVRSTCDDTNSTVEPNSAGIYNSDYVRLGVYQIDSTLKGAYCYDFFAYGDAWGRKDAIDYGHYYNYGLYKNWQEGVWVR